MGSHTRRFDACMRQAIIIRWPSAGSVICHREARVENAPLTLSRDFFSDRSSRTLLVPAHSNLTDPEQWQKPTVAKHLIAEIRATMKPFDPRLTPIFRRGMIADTLLRHPAMRFGPQHPRRAFIDPAPQHRPSTGDGRPDCRTVPTRSGVDG